MRLAYAELDALSYAHMQVFLSDDAIICTLTEGTVSHPDPELQCCPIALQAHVRTAATLYFGGGEGGPMHSSDWLLSGQKFAPR